jgi:hypothetical protein
LARSGTINSWAGDPFCDRSRPNNVNVTCGPVPPSMLNNCVASLTNIPQPSPSAIDALKFAANPFSKPVAIAGQEYRDSIATNAYTASRDIGITYVKISGPAWLNVARDGTLSGTPRDSDVAVSNFLVSATTQDGISTVIANLRISVIAKSVLSSKLGFPPSPSPADFINSQGVFYGLFANSNVVTASNSRFVNLNKTARPAYRGLLLLGGSRYSIHGRFDTNGIATNTIRLSSTVSLTVRLRSTFGGDQIQGSVNNGTNWWSDLVADRLVFNRLHTNNLAARYTLSIPPDTDSANSSAGYGIGTVRVNANGTVALAGKLADGTPFTQSSALSREGFWPLYAFVPAGKGLVISWMQFTNLPPAAYATGQLIWSKMAIPRAIYYRKGFTNSVEAQAVRYTPPASGQRALPWSQGGDGTLVFSGGGLSMSFTNALGIDPLNRVSTIPADKLHMSIAPSSGLFRGSATDPVSRRIFSFQGVLWQTNQIGRGFYLGPVSNGEGQCGEVLLRAAP